MASESHESIRQGASAPRADAPASGRARRPTVFSRADRAAQIAARVDSALAEAAATMASFGDWDESVFADEHAGEDDLLPLEFQLADFDRAVDSMLEARDRLRLDADRLNAGAAMPPDE